MKTTAFIGMIMFLHLLLSPAPGIMARGPPTPGCRPDESGQKSGPECRRSTSLLEVPQDHMTMENGEGDHLVSCPCQPQVVYDDREHKEKFKSLKHYEKQVRNMFAKEEEMRLFGCIVSEAENSENNRENREIVLEAVGKFGNLLEHVGLVL